MEKDNTEPKGGCPTGGNFFCGCDWCLWYEKKEAKNKLEDNSKATEWIAIAKKYIPDLSAEQEVLVRRMANCKKYGQQNSLKFRQENCNCYLCLQLAVLELKDKFLNNEKI